MISNDWNSFIKVIEDNPTAITGGGQSEIEFENSDPCPDFENLIPEHFFNKDGTPLFDTKTNDVFRLSQSFIASLRQALIDESCLYRLWFRSVLRKGLKDEKVTDPQRLGNLFEYELTGALDYNGNKPIPKIVNVGKINEGIAVADQRVIDNAKYAREALKEFGIDLDAKDTYTVDTKFIFKCFDGSTDLRYFDHRILDSKYSGILQRPDKFTDNSWNEENIKTKFSKKIQAGLYSLLYFFNHGARPTFEYIVFSSKPKDAKEFQVFGVDISEGTLNMLKWMLIKTANLFQEMINEDKFTENPSFENCKDCPVNDCKVRQEYRKKIIVKI